VRRSIDAPGSLDGYAEQVHAPGHSTAGEAGRIAAAAGVRALALTHVPPSRTVALADLVAEARRFAGAAEVFAAEDGLILDVQRAGAHGADERVLILLSSHRHFLGVGWNPLVSGSRVRVDSTRWRKDGRFPSPESLGGPVARVFPPQAVAGHATASACLAGGAEIGEEQAAEHPRGRSRASARRDPAVSRR
jgi:hypothetical protein